MSDKYTRPLKMTPLELIEEIRICQLSGEDCEQELLSLTAFLERPEIQALTDPTLRKAAEVVISKLPELLEMEGKAQGAPWKATPHFIQPTDSWDLVVQDTAGGRTLALTPASAILAATARNLLHEAAQAAKGEGA